MSTRTITSVVDGGAAGLFLSSREAGEVLFEAIPTARTFVDDEDAREARREWLSVLATPHGWTTWSGRDGGSAADATHRALASCARFGRALGHSPALGTTAERMRGLLAGSVDDGARVLVVGDLEAAALGLTGPYAVTFAHDHDEDWAAGPQWEAVEVAAHEHLFPSDDGDVYDAVVVDCLPAGAALTTHLSRAITRVREGGRIFAVVHPRYRDEILPGLLRNLPVRTAALHIDVVWRILPGYSLQDVPWDVWELERQGSLLIGAPEGPPARRTHLDSVDRVVLSEEVLAFTAPVTGAHLDRALDVFLAASGLSELARDVGETGDRSRRHTVLEGGGFVDVSAEREHGLVTFALGDWDPLQHLRLGTALLLSAPPRRDHVVFRGVA